LARGWRTAAPIHSPAEWASLGSFLQAARRLSDAYGVVLIFDEIVSGFRTALGGVQELCHVTPDLTVVSKAMANGFPISVVVGKRAVMEAWNETVITSTFAGETMSLAASLATIHEFETRDVVGHIWQLGQMLIDGVNEIAERRGLPIRAGGCPGLPSVPAQDKERGQALLGGAMKGLLEQGIMPYSAGLWYICYSHTTGHIERTLDIIDEILERA
jgi:glutamate-1-semialdehyde aminotransferase